MGESFIKTIHGRIIYKNDKEIAIASNPFDFGEIIIMPMDRINGIKLSQVSMMPSQTIDGMNKDELMDLIAYLISGGNRRHQSFRRN